ncbi:MAG: hypothetical protein V4477_16720 [Pseudomonadota bacterium]
MPSPDQMGSPFAAARAMPLTDGYGGKINAQDELPIHALGDDYAVEGSGIVNRLPTMPSGITVFLRMIAAPTFKNSVRLICPNAVDYVAAAGDLCIARSDGDGVWRLFVLPASPIVGTVKSIKKRMLTGAGSGTYTPSAFTVYATFELVAGGGGGGGAATAAGNVASGGGGGSGGVSIITLTAAAIGASKPYTIGAGGAGGAATPANGGTGGNTTFNTSTGIALGGVGGGALTVGAGLGGAGGAAGTVGSGEPTYPGGSGGTGFVLSTSFAALTGFGANSPYGGGGAAIPFATGQAGNPATGYGAGGGGAGSFNGSAGTAGGAGSPGVIIVTEYLSV